MTTSYIDVKLKEVRNAALEEAAKLAESQHDDSFTDYAAGFSAAAGSIASKIRALIK